MTGLPAEERAQGRDHVASYLAQQTAQFPYGDVRALPNFESYQRGAVDIHIHGSWMSKEFCAVLQHGHVPLHSGMQHLAGTTLCGDDLNVVHAVTDDDQIDVLVAVVEGVEHAEIRGRTCPTRRERLDVLDDCGCLRVNPLQPTPPLPTSLGISLDIPSAALLSTERIGAHDWELRLTPAGARYESGHAVVERGADVVQVVACDDSDLFVGLDAADESIHDLVVLAFDPSVMRVWVAVPVALYERFELYEVLFSPRKTQLDGEHECYPTNERWPVCETCGREMDPGIGGDADRAWFKRQRERIASRRPVSGVRGSEASDE